VSEDRRSSVRLLDLASGAHYRFTSGPGSALLPLWSPLGDQIVFARDNIIEGHTLWVKRLGSESDSRITDRGFWIAHDWHRNTLLVSGDGSTGFWRLTIDGSRPPEPWFSSTARHNAAQFSPDGRWVAYASEERGAFDVYLRRFPEADRQVRVSTAGGNMPRWRPGEKALFYLQNDMLMEVDVDIRETVKVGVPRQLFSLRENCGYAVLPDRRFVVCRPVDSVPAPAITIVLNWAAGLKAK
jgi:Tol biopolymer transport system component